MSDLETQADIAEVILQNPRKPSVAHLIGVLARLCESEWRTANPIMKRGDVPITMRAYTVCCVIEYLKQAADVATGEAKYGDPPLVHKETEHLRVLVAALGEKEE